MKERNFGGLIVQHRKSAVFFLRKANIEKPNSSYESLSKSRSKLAEQHKDLVCINELKRVYNFTDDEFKEFYEYCNSIASEAWSNFTPKAVDSWGADYDDYYDRDFDNNGSLSIGQNTIRIEGPYAQPKSNGDIVRLIKFNKRKFESFVYDLHKKVGESDA